MATTAEVVICGAGIAGIATAYYLTKQHGITDITVVDPHAPLSQTTAKSGENYRNWWPFPQLAAFTNRSIDLMEALAAETDNQFQIHRRGYLYVSTQADVAAFVTQLEATYAWETDQIRTHLDYTNSAYDPQLSDGYLGRPDGIDILTDPRQIRRWFPHMSEKITVAVHVRRAGALSVQLLGGYLWEQAKAAGARLVRGTVSAVQQDGQGVCGVTVQTAAGTEQIATHTLVNAAGAFLPHIARLVEIDLPVYSVFQQKIAMPDPHGVLPRNAPFTIFLDRQSVAWREEERTFWQSDPEYAWLLQRFPGGIHIRPEGSGDSSWIKLGWAINQQAEEPVWSPQGSPEFPELLIRGAARLVPGLARYAGKLPQSLTHYGGYYTKTRENLPLIGPMGVDGAYVVGALSGYGTMAGCAAGELCATWAADATLPDYAQVLSPQRYATAEGQALIAQLAETGEL